MSEIHHAPLAPNTSAAIEWQGHRILLCNSGGTHYAIEDRCTHQETPLAGGRVRNGFISCPLHGVKFDLETGAPKGNLTRVSVKTFAVEEADGQILITVG